MRLFGPSHSPLPPSPWIDSSVANSSAVSLFRCIDFPLLFRTVAQLDCCTHPSSVVSTHQISDVYRMSIGCPICCGVTSMTSDLLYWPLYASFRSVRCPILPLTVILQFALMTKYISVYRNTNAHKTKHNCTMTFRPFNSCVAPPWLNCLVSSQPWTQTFEHRADDCSRLLEPRALLMCVQSTNTNYDTDIDFACRYQSSSSAAANDVSTHEKATFLHLCVDFSILVSQNTLP